MSSPHPLATIAEYFRLGIQVGLLSPEQAVAWADSVLVNADVPPDGIIDISWSEGVPSAMDALAAVPGERNRPIAGGWLLGLLRQAIPEDEEALHRIVQRAMQIARQAELGDAAYYRFDLIDDELSLARIKACGTVEACRINLATELADYEPLVLERTVP